MDDLKLLMPVSILFSYWRADGHRGVPDNEHSPLRLALSIAEPDFVTAAGLGCRHHTSDGCVAIFGQAADTAPDQETRSELFCQTIALVNVAFPISDMYAALRSTGLVVRTA